MTRAVDTNGNRSAVCGECCTRLENVGVTIGRNEILKAINLHIHCGQLTVIVGPNGSGKTTLLRTILGEIAYTGRMYIELSDVKGGSRKKLVVGYVPQKLEFDTTSPVTVLDLFGASISKKPIWLGHPRETRTKALDMLEAVKADHLLHARVGRLSGGELQRVLLALALTPVPDLLLLDEPVSGIDPGGTDLFYRMVSQLRLSYHLAILLVSHDVAVAAQYADRMLFLNQSIIADGSPAEVLANDALVNVFGTFAPPIPALERKGLPPCICAITGTEVGT